MPFGSIPFIDARELRAVRAAEPCVPRVPADATQRVRAIAAAPRSDARYLTDRSGRVEDQRAGCHGLIGAQTNEHPARVAEVPYLRDRLLSEEAPLLEVDRRLQPGLRRERSLVEVHAERRDPQTNTPSRERAPRDGSKLRVGERR